VSAAINSMIDAGLLLTRAEAQARIDAIYKEKGIEFQNVFDHLLYDVFQKVDYKILSAGSLPTGGPGKPPLFPIRTST